MIDNEKFEWKNNWYPLLDVKQRLGILRINWYT